jgi:hypothetical protein
MNTKISSLLKSLLYFSKRIDTFVPKDESISWHHIARFLEAEHGYGYGPNSLRFGDTIRLLLTAYQEAIENPDLSLPGRNIAIQELLLTPLTGTFAMEWPSWNVNFTEPVYSLERVYEKFIRRIISDLMMTTVSKCEEYVAYSNEKDEKNAN